MKLYQVTELTEKDPKTLQKLDKFIVAENISKVIEDLKLDSKTNIIGINEIAPILKIIK